MFVRLPWAGVAHQISPQGEPQATEAIAGGVATRPAGGAGMPTSIRREASLPRLKLP